MGLDLSTSFEHKNAIIFLTISQICVLRVSFETILLTTRNICFG